jgi:hypothetical protein
MERREVIDLFGETVVLEISKAKGARKPTRPTAMQRRPEPGRRERLVGPAGTASG